MSTIAWRIAAFSKDNKCHKVSISVFLPPVRYLIISFIFVCILVSFCYQRRYVVADAPIGTGIGSNTSTKESIGKTDVGYRNIRYPFYFITGRNAFNLFRMNRSALYSSIKSRSNFNILVSFLSVVVLLCRYIRTQ